MGKTTGGYTFTTGTSDFLTALRTPDGMKASAYKSLEAEIATAFGADEKGEKMTEIAVGIITGTIGRKIADGQLVDALIQSGKLTSDIIDLMNVLYEEQKQQESQGQIPYSSTCGDSTVEEGSVRTCN